MEPEEITPEREELIKIICSYMSEALEAALEETQDLEDDEQMNVISRHISKTLNYLTDEGWIEEGWIEDES